MKLEYKFQSEVEFEETIMQNATIDSLTEAYNRGFFMKRAEEELSMAKRTKTARCLMMVDVDFFKMVNDTYGHPAGDFVLQSLAALIEHQKRKEDVFGRFGGDEFIVMLRGVEAPDGAFQFAERIRKAVEQMDVEYNETRIPIHVSIGAHFEEGPTISTLTEMIEKADKALYEAKEEGRNRVVVIS
jgi:diguanylate cyclase (GGDEF)-like protein